VPNIIHLALIYDLEKWVGLCDHLLQVRVHVHWVARQIDLDKAGEVSKIVDGLDFIDSVPL